MFHTPPHSDLGILWSKIITCHKYCISRGQETCSIKLYSSKGSGQLSYYNLSPQKEPICTVDFHWPSLEQCSEELCINKLGGGRKEWTDNGHRERGFIFTCLLANTSNAASLSSSSLSILKSSSLASPIRSLSLLSTTKIRPGERTATRSDKQENRIPNKWIESTYI